MTLLILYNCTNLLFFYYDFSSFIQNFQNLTRAHRTIQFFKEHADKHKKHLQRKPIYFHQGFRYLQHFSALQDAFPPSAIFSSDCYIGLAFRELLSFVMLLNVSSIAYLSNTFFKKIQFFSEVFYTPCLIQTQNFIQ